MRSCNVAKLSWPKGSRSAKPAVSVGAWPAGSSIGRRKRTTFWNAIEQLSATIDLLFQFVHPGDRDFVRQTLDDAAKEKTDFDMEHRLLMPDGRVKHVHISGRAMKTGDLDFVGAVTDITAAKKAEEKIRQSEKEARQLLDFRRCTSPNWGPTAARLYTQSGVAGLFRHHFGGMAGRRLAAGAASAGRRDRDQ